MISGLNISNIRDVCLIDIWEAFIESRDDQSYLIAWQQLARCLFTALGSIRRSVIHKASLRAYRPVFGQLNCLDLRLRLTMVFTRRQSSRLQSTPKVCLQSLFSYPRRAPQAPGEMPMLRKRQSQHMQDSSTDYSIVEARNVLYQQ